MGSATTLYYVLLFIVIVLQRFPKDNISTSRPLKSVCDHDSHVLCPECFPSPPKCDEFEQLFMLHEGSLFNQINAVLNAHTTRIGAFRGSEYLAVLKHLNRDKTMKKLLEQFCDSYPQPRKGKCTWTRHGSTEEATHFIQQSILDATRIEGCIFCATSSSGQTLQRFLALFKPTDSALWNLLAVRTNVEPLLLKLFATHGTSLYVPKLLATVGFSIVESYEGQTLEHYYEHPLAIRMMIASKLIKAAFAFTEGIHGFRFYLTDINPDNVVVKVENDSRNVLVSIVDLDNVIILDSLANTFSTDDGENHVHGKIECNGCFAYVQEDVCRYRNSDLNLFATCQLLLENLNGNYAAGLLHNDHSKDLDPSMAHPNDAPLILHNLLEECVHCQPPNCRNRSLILHDMLAIIDQTIAQS
ncbi:uncharacterized protein LOC126558188 [Anopheles maculipalpis]|uniref:uncharacterized protein LOC126558188 n=1 Tax=Anopheles maculipalpis TaxID=1496333 RepID=UPI0021593005|nr:uncharacterized protein LOC126558188 [Anopheles maculipalpis]